MKINFTELTVKELDEIIRNAQTEKETRKKRVRVELIKAFEKAWRDLEDFGIEIGNDGYALDYNDIYFE